MTILSITETSNFTYNIGWYFYVSHSVAVLHITECSKFTYKTEWQFYL